MSEDVRMTRAEFEAAIAADEMKFADEVHAQHRKALAAARRDELERAADAFLNQSFVVTGDWLAFVVGWLRARAVAPVPATLEEPHEFVPGKYSGSGPECRHVMGGGAEEDYGFCRLPADHPIHQATPEEPPKVRCNGCGQAVTWHPSVTHHCPALEAEHQRATTEETTS